MDIDSFQQRAINFLNNEIYEQKRKNIDISVSSFSYVATWGENIGLEFLKYKVLKISNFFKLLFVLIKDFYSTLRSHEVEFLNELKTNNQRRIILSSASLKDFNEDGSYIDRYFKINSKDYNEFIFLLLYSHEKLPKNLNKNIFLLKRKKNNIFLGIFYCLKYIFIYLKKSLKLKYFFHEFSHNSQLAVNLINLVKNKINFKNIDLILVPYEGMPFQQKFFFEAKKINQELSTLGYDHSAPHAMPLNMFHRIGSPDRLLVNGNSQMYHMTKFLNWPKEKIKIVPSLRYKENSDEKFENIIFFPWKIFDDKKILKDLEKYLQSLPNSGLSTIKIKTHPICINKNSQEKTKKKIQKLFNKYSEKFSKFSNKKNISIFIGSTTGVIVALEKGLEVLHICFDPLFESYSETLWPDLVVKKISQNSFIYQLKKRGSFIKFGAGEDIFEKYYIN